MADWYTVYEAATGRLESVGTVVAPDEVLAEKGLAKKLLPGERPTVPSNWDTVSLTFSPKPPRPPDVDRVGEFLGKLSFTLPAGRAAEVQALLVELLGSSRFRDPDDPYGL